MALIQTLEGSIRPQTRGSQCSFDFGVKCTFVRVDHTFILTGESIVNIKITNVEAEIKLYPKLFMNTIILGYKIRTF